MWVDSEEEWIVRYCSQNIVYRQPIIGFSFMSLNPTFYKFFLKPAQCKDDPEECDPKGFSLSFLPDKCEDENVSLLLVIMDLFLPSGNDRTSA